MSDSLWPHGLQHSRLLCPSPSPGACSNSMSIESVMPSNHLILCHPLLLPSIFPSIRIFISLLSRGLSRVFFSTTVEKRQFFSTLPSLLSNSHNHTWPLERSYPWLYGPMSAKWCLCFMTLCLNKEKLSQLNIVSLNKSCEKNLKQNIKKNSRNLYDKN